MTDLASRLAALSPAKRALFEERQKRAAAMDPIAVIGLACRYPGAPDADAFWQLLKNDGDAIQEVPEDRWDAGAWFDLDPATPGTMNTRWGGFLDDLPRFDAPFFGISPAEAAQMDPQHRLLLETAWGALEDSGQDPQRLAGSRTGVFVGIFMDDYRRLELADAASINAFSAAGTVFSIAANRLSFHLDLQGPSLALDTACSSSLVAVHLACQSLATGESSLALAGGVNVLLTPGASVEIAKSGVLAPDGRCKSFADNADGYVRSEGVGLLVLKPLAKALEDGDPIRAVIRGSAVNHDGRSNGLTAPSPKAQERVVREAFRRAAISPAEIDYVETHGSGTALGDPIEAKALGAVVGPDRPADRPCWIGSVKSNIGHTETAAGVAGVIKTILALEHRELPASIHCAKTSSRIDFPRLGLRVVQKGTPWPQGAGPARAGVSAFGFGGTNAHLVLEEAPVRRPVDEASGPRLVLLSAADEGALERSVQNLANRLDGAAPSLTDTAHTLAVGRTTLEHRLAVVAKDRDDLLRTLTSGDPAAILRGRNRRKDRGVVFLFPGLGDHYPGMSRELYHTYARFREEVDHCATRLAPQLGLDLRSLLLSTESAPPQAAPGLDLRRMMGRARNQEATPKTPLDRTEIAQPAVFVVEYALACLLRSWGIEPRAMVGYSLGEYVAACLAGVFSLDDALDLVAARAQAIGGLAGGSMLAVPLSEEELQLHLGDELDLAAVNGELLSVAAGPTPAIEDLRHRLAEQGIVSSPLKTSHAFHSAMLGPAMGAVEDLARKRERHPPRIPFVSNVTGAWISPEEAADPSYWSRHMVGTVRFRDALATLTEGSDAILLEVGPGQALSSFARQFDPRDSAQEMTQETPPLLTVPTIRHEFDAQDDVAFLLSGLGRLWLGGAAIDWRCVGEEFGGRRVPLPTYPFGGGRYWLDTTTAAAPRAPEMKGRNPRLEDWFYAPLWRQTVPPPRVNTAHSWLILSTGSDFDRRLAQRLGRGGGRVLTVLPGAKYEARSPEEFVVDPTSPSDYENLLFALGDDLPDRLVHLWSAAPEFKSFAESQEAGLYSLMYLVRALGNAGRNETRRILLVSRGVQRVTGGEDLDPNRSTLLGARVVIPQEYLHLECRSIDLETRTLSPTLERRLLNRLADEFHFATDEVEVAYRGAERWVAEMQPAPLPPDEGTLPLRPAGVYLITGGLGGVGGELAKALALASTHGGTPPRLVLLGRSPLPPRDQWAQELGEAGPQAARIRRVERLEEMGAQVEVMAADVAAPGRMAEVVAHCRETWGGLHGVIHAAGVADTDALRDLREATVEDCARHFHAKVHGTLRLAEALMPGDGETAPEDLDFVVLCSSISSLLGGLGFGPYAAANRFLDAYAEYQTAHSSVPWISIDWDTWGIDEAPGAGAGDSGAGATVAELEMSGEEGMEVFLRILGQWGSPRMAISTGDLEARLDQWVRMIGLRQPAAPTGAGAGLRHDRPDLTTPYVAPRSDLEATVCTLWQRLLGLGKVGVHDNFFELGGHSLLGTQFFAQLRSEVGVDLPLRSLFDKPTAAGLAEALDAMLWMAPQPEPAGEAMLEGEL